MNKKYAKWIGILIIVVLNIALISGLAIICYPVALLIFAPSDGSLFDAPDTPVEYIFPASAKIVEQDATAADFFGDYSVCASFTLPDSEIDRLIKDRFDWFTSDGRQLSTETEDWKAGTLPEEIFSFAEGFGNCKKHSLDKSNRYKYLYKYQEGGQERVIVIDEEQNTVYYSRSSW